MKKSYNPKNKICSKYKITINGVEYNSIRDFCAKNNVKENTIYVQLKRYGLPTTSENIENLIEGKYKKHYEYHKIFENLGIKDKRKHNEIIHYLKLKNIEITKENIVRYLNKEFSYNSNYHKYKRFTDYVIDGVHYNSARDFCAKNNLLSSAFFTYIKLHKLKCNSKSLKQYLDKVNATKFKFNGEIFNNFSEFCKKYNICRNAIKGYLSRHNLNRDEKNVKKYLKMKGINYENLSRNK